MFNINKNIIANLSSFTNEISKYNYTDRVYFKIKYFILLILLFTLIFTVATKPEEWNWIDIPENINNPPDRKSYYKTYFGNMFHFSIISFTTTGYGDIIPITLKTRLLTHLLLFLSFVIAIL